MRPSTILHLLLLVGFLGISAVALADFGYLGLWALVGQDSGTVQLFTDLSVAMCLLWAFLLRDARARGVSPWPYLLLTLAAGSLGPLLYLLRTRGAGRGAEGAGAAPPPA